MCHCPLTDKVAGTIQKHLSNNRNIDKFYINATKTDVTVRLRYIKRVTI